jgi:hypothetical protein
VTSSVNIFYVVVGDEVEDLPCVVRHILLPVFYGEQGLVTEQTTILHHDNSTHLKNLLVIQIKLQDCTEERAQIEK